MQTESVNTAFSKILQDCGRDQDGSRAIDLLLAKSQELLPTDRSSLIGVLSGWIKLKDPALTHYALSLAVKLGLSELRGDILRLKDDLPSISGKSTRLVFEGLIQQALSASGLTSGWS